jgi:hypothetical protein
MPATEKPANNEIPFKIPPSLKASGIIEFANITIMAPAAKAIDIEIMGGLAR